MSNESKPEPRLSRRRMLGVAGLGALAAGLVATTGAAQAQGYPPLPPPRFEPPPPPPPPGMIWEPGHWRWDGYRYAWIRGHYIRRGPRYGQFVPGHWANRGGAWVWIPQHWR